MFERYKMLTPEIINSFSEETKKMGKLNCLENRFREITHQLVELEQERSNLKDRIINTILSPFKVGDTVMYGGKKCVIEVKNDGVYVRYFYSTGKLGEYPFLVSILDRTIDYTKYFKKVEEDV